VEPEEKKESKFNSKSGKAFLIFSVFNVAGLVIVLSFPEFIGEEEKTFMDYLPWNFIFIIWGIFAILIGIGQTKKPPLFEPVWFRDSKLMKVFISILAVPSLSFLPACMSVFAIYGLINYSFVNEKIALEGKLYKKEIKESSRRRSSTIRKEYYIYFNEDKRYSFKVDKPTFTELQEGDSLELNVLKGRFDGYYNITDSFSFWRKTPLLDHLKEED
jgi:hypothetical protein